MDQRTIPRLGELHKKTTAPAHLVASCRDYKQAVSLCMDLSQIRRTRRLWAELLGMKEGSLSLILNGSGDRRRTLDPDLFPVIEELAGNNAITRFFQMQSEGLLAHQSKKAEVEQLKARLRELEDYDMRTA